MSDSLRNKLIFATLSIGVCLLIFVGYRILYMTGVSEYSKEFISGCIGAVITIFATAALLRSQTHNEITKDQLSGIFEKKLEVYSEFVAFLNDIHNDGELTHEEMKTLIEWGSKLSLICRPGVVRAIYEFAFQVIAFGTTDYQTLTKKQKEQWKKWMLTHYEDMETELSDETICEMNYSGIPKIIAYLREDISHKKLSDFEENLNMEITLAELFSLHAVDEIVINADGTYSITAAFDVIEKKPRKPRSTPKKVEA